MQMLQHQQWVYFALIVVGIISYIAFIRWRDRRWIESQFGNKNVHAVSFGVNYWGRATEPGKPRRSAGFLLLLPDRIVYRSRIKKIELQIPGSKIARVYHETNHKGVDLHQSLVKIDFLNSNNERDTAAFRVPYPPQWINAIENTLIKKAQ